VLDDVDKLVIDVKVVLEDDNDLEDEDVDKDLEVLDVDNDLEVELEDGMYILPNYLF